MELKEIRERCEAATPGPWEWDIGTKNKYCELQTTHSGKYYVMGFSRWGTDSACPTFQVYERYEGPVKERISKGRARADKLAKSYPGKEHHDGFDDYIDHPDAAFIAHARTDIPHLLDRIDALDAENTELIKFRDEMECYLSEKNLLEAQTDEAYEENERLRAENERQTARAERAIADLRESADCSTCKHNEANCRKCAARSQWEWRGEDDK